MKVFSFKDIVNLDIEYKSLYVWAINALKNKNKALLKPKISLKQDGGVFCNTMPCIIETKNKKYGGVKIVTRYPKRIPSLEASILLFDANSGNNLAIMDGTYITAMRTGAVAALSIKLLAKRNFNTISIIGLGNVSRATLLILLSIYPKRKFKIKIYKYKKQEVDFINRFVNYVNIEFEIVDDLHMLAKGSDVIISGITYTKEDLFNDDDFDEGVLVVPIHTPGFTNCDLFFDKVYGDDYEHISSFKYFDKFKCFSEIADVINGSSKGRESDKERILAYNVGIAAQDIYFASKIYEFLKDKKTMKIDLKTPKNKYWV